MRRSRDMFRSNLLPQSQAISSSPFSNASSSVLKVTPPALASEQPEILSRTGTSAQGANDEERLRVFYATARKDLDVLRRAALMNRMYEGEKLVVERPRLIVGGGGAGAEASTGGSGQPKATAQSAGGAPPSGVWPESKQK